MLFVSSQLSQKTLNNLSDEIQANGDMTKALQDLEKQHGDRGKLVVAEVLEAKDVAGGRTVLKHAAALGKTEQFTQLAHGLRLRVSTVGKTSRQ